MEHSWGSVRAGDSLGRSRELASNAQMHTALGSFPLPKRKKGWGKRRTVDPCGQALGMGL